MFGKAACQHHLLADIIKVLEKLAAVLFGQ